MSAMPHPPTNDTRPASLGVALGLAASGRPVFPCCYPDEAGACGCGQGHTGKEVGKAPIGRLVPHGHLDATTDPETIRRWWAQCPQANVGLNLERAGLVMVDPDSDEAQAETVGLGRPPTAIRASRFPAFLYERTADCPATTVTKRGASGAIDVKANGYAVVFGRHREGHDIYIEELGDPAPVPEWSAGWLREAADKRNGREVHPADLPADLPRVDVEALRVHPDIKRLIREGRDADPDHYRDRSGPAWRVLHELIEAGCDDATIAGVFLDPENAIGEKARERGRGRDWLADEIGRARADAEATPRLRFSADGSEECGAGAIATTVQPEGVVYTEAGGSLNLLVVPKGKCGTRYRITLRRGDAVLDTSTIDPSSRSQRNAFLRGVPVSDDERETLGRLLLHVALNIDADVGGWYRVRFEELERQAAEADEARRSEREARREALKAEAWEAGCEILNDPALLYRVGETARELGLAGEGVTARLSYLILTSRVGPRPINAVVKGSSSAGKSFTVETTTKLFPESAFWKFTAMSAKALIYVEESFAHRVIIVYEQHGGEEADYFIRTLQSEGHLKYLVTQKDPMGNLVAVPIEKEGPTSFITTTTKTALHDENETRIWSVSIDESEAQTTGVLGSVAGRYNSHGPEPDLEPWRQAQEWLGLAEATEANIEFSHWLAGRMPARPLRIRRDFGRLLELIQASAVLHQAQREIGDDGRVIARVQDYANAYALVADVFKATQEGVTKRTREILGMLQELYDEKVAGGDGAARQASLTGSLSEVGVSYEELAKRAKIGKPNISRHIAAATELGLVENLETRKGAPARLRPHLELLAPGTALPPPEELAEAFPGLADGVWVHPISGEEKYFLGPDPQHPQRPPSTRRDDRCDDHRNGSATPEHTGRVATDVGADGAPTAGEDGVVVAAGLAVAGALRVPAATGPPGGDGAKSGGVAGVAGPGDRDLSPPVADANADAERLDDRAYDDAEGELPW